MTFICQTQPFQDIDNILLNSIYYKTFTYSFTLPLSLTLSFFLKQITLCGSFLNYGQTKDFYHCLFRCAKSSVVFSVFPIKLVVYLKYTRVYTKNLLQPHGLKTWDSSVQNHWFSFINNILYYILRINAIPFH